jgi:hypothetical protein
MATRADRRARRAASCPHVSASPGTLRKFIEFRLDDRAGLEPALHDGPPRRTPSGISLTGCTAWGIVPAPSRTSVGTALPRGGARPTRRSRMDGSPLLKANARPECSRSLNVRLERPRPPPRCRARHPKPRGRALRPVGRRPRQRLRRHTQGFGTAPLMRGLKAPHHEILRVSEMASFRGFGRVSPSGGRRRTRFLDEMGPCV